MAVIRRYWGIVVVELMWLLLVTGVVLVGVDWLRPETRLRGVGLLVFCAGGVMAILLKVDSKTETVSAKIDHSVGDVWDAGGRAKERQMKLEAECAPELAAVHELAPRR